jgi:3-dehydroquinate dehydratase/shikimate dehydrogenase
VADRTLCISLMPQTNDEALAGFAEAARWGAMAELRLDAMRQFDLERLLAAPPCPVIVTYRPQREGGRYDGPEPPRLAALRQAARLGARYIDVEHDALGALGDVPPDRLIVSYHDFRGVPPDLEAVHARLAKSGASITKLAVTARHILDTVPVLRLLQSARTPTIALAMGARGLITRILAPKFGAPFTYAALTDGDEAGPGQVSIRRMRDLYRADRIGPTTRLYGVIADPVGHSLSPQLHNAAFAEAGLDAVYLPLWVEGDPAAFVRAMREFDFDGYSVTIPHKQTVMAALDCVDPMARRIGAVNTIRRRADGSLAGTNTDWSAGLAAIEAVVGQGWLRGKRALILGAGGLGRAMAFALQDRGSRITLSDTEAERAETLARQVGAETCPIGRIAPQSPDETTRGGSPDPPHKAWDILLNCTPIGMHPKPEASPVPPTMLRKDMVVYDAVYNPTETRLLREARAAGCRTVEGIDHFVRQAAEQFEWWTGRPAPIDLMRRTVIAALA